ncbi:hypothetical protein POX_e06234 [Penicillium oxalicum]|uniref:hypothetical protein n=1 Tax=Penicillium oxalicum TaxID=69781 RepID=UPI0020B7B371|nr:hypothetical protein POX_e06234 [Penicillium oxalicum]KAI2788221.1 hypothetical protein POX_e06234 [Penicillium oxalicum]
MDQKVIERARSAPESIAVIEDDHVLSYKDMILQSQGLAQTLDQNKIGREEPIGILLPPGVNLVVAQLAVIFARGTCVPVDPAMPRTRISRMFHDIGVKRVIVAAQGVERSDQRVEGMDYITLQSTPASDAHCNFDDELASPAILSPEHRTHILFTSGSTGRPKPVQIRAQNIMHLANKTPFTPLSPDDRVTHFNNPGFDLSLFEIWVTLLSGATAVAIQKTTVTDPPRLKSFLEHQGVTVIMLPVALMEILVFGEPSIFQSLRHVMSAGDVASVKAMRAMCKPPKYLWNTYGPTECTTLATAMLVSEEELKQDRISIGRAVGDLNVYLFDQNLQPIRESGIEGEICIAGPQLSAGYLNMPAKTEECFIHLDRSVLNVQESPGNIQGSVRLYRTGDYAKWRSDLKCLDFCGRRDRQVKHGGFRVELSEVEAHLLCHDGVESAAVVHVPSTVNNGVSLLVAFVKTNGQQNIKVESILAFVRERSPSYMAPDYVELVKELPLTVNGKVDRQALQDRYTEWKNNQDHQTHSAQCLHTAGGLTTKDVIKKLWKQILPQSHVSDHDDFIEQGANSLQNAALISLIRRDLDCHISMEQFLQNTRLRDLVSLVDNMTSTVSPAHATDETRT